MAYYILRVIKNISNNQKLVTIPKESDIKEKDYVLVKKITDENLAEIIKHDKQ